MIEDNMCVSNIHDIRVHSMCNRAVRSHHPTLSLSLSSQLSLALGLFRECWLFFRRALLLIASIESFIIDYARVLECM